MMAIFITIFCMIMVAGIMANYANNKDNEEYGDYLLQLDEIKKRKKKRSV